MGTEHDTSYWLLDRSFNFDEVRWTWYVFGPKLLIIEVPFEVPWYRRVLTKILLGSVWERKLHNRGIGSSKLLAGWVELSVYE